MDVFLLIARWRDRLWNWMRWSKVRFTTEPIKPTAYELQLKRQRANKKLLKRFGKHQLRKPSRNKRRSKRKKNR